MLLSTGHSMGQTIMAGELIICTKASRNYTVGDVVLFYLPDGRLCVHRILYILMGKAFVCGDNASYGHWVKLEDIHGLISVIINVQHKKSYSLRPVSRKELVMLRKTLIRRRFFNLLFRKTPLWNKYLPLVIAMNQKNNQWQDSLRIPLSSPTSSSQNKEV